ncbi:nuclear condensing complex subunit [Lineolata rhizophorae]|uniref:Nuclear condensing complex subunit n=1 Tax=Lineolata rhizophorae TaxID=578093 RepID=A0A6A6NUY7_9PEZI|nr:nuclear condensing complex subunit [Lineolata rhizophorae]
MPGRVSTRNSADSRKLSTQTLKSRTSSTRTSALAVDIPDEGEDTSLRARICSIFSDAQRNVATQRKLVISLRKLHEECCYEPVNPPKSKGRATEEDFGETEFNEEIGRCLLRVLTVKKSEPVGDRSVRFLGQFLKHASEKDNAIAQPDADTTDAFPETPASRLTSYILNLLLPLLVAKDKTVRFRATQIISHIVNTLDSIDDELFQLVRLGLLKRIRDKESAVRVQAVLGLGRLADDGDNENDNSDDSDDESSGSGILEKLLDILQNDPSADVRRSLLMNLPFAPATLPYLLERARDCDAATRRALYSRLLPALGDFRHLSLTHREKLLRWGLRDRDENVRKATARLFRERWIEDCAISRLPDEEGAAPPPGQLSAPNYDALLELLERIDVVNSGVESGIAFEAMQAFWEGRPDYREDISFEDPFWDELTAESIFVARTFNAFCRHSGDSMVQSMAEDKMPEVTKFAFILQRHLNVLIEGVQKVALEQDPDAEEDTVQQEFAVEQLLHIALTLDYSDEIGRRKMFSTMRESLAMPELPEECTKLVIEVLRMVCDPNPAGEREFCGIVLEAIAEVHDTIIGDDSSVKDESFHSARSEMSDESTPTKAKKVKKSKSSSSEDGEEGAQDEEKAVREIMVNMKCLHIAQCMLQNVQCDLEQNSDLVTMLNNLVVPAVRSQEAPIRERGLLCLGLCCLLSKNLAAENLTLFLHCFAKGHEALQAIAIQIISDILITHPSLLAPLPPGADTTTASPTKSPSKSNDPQANPLLKPIYKLYTRALSSPHLSVQTPATTALSKLYLSSVFKDPALLHSLVLAFFNPDTRANPHLRQALTYFLPVYCHSRAENQLRLARVAVGALRVLVGVREELEVDGEGAEEDMVGLAVVAGCLAEWTDPRRVVGFSSDGAAGSGDASKVVSGDVNAHMLLAEDVLERVGASGCGKEERKALLTLLAKLALPNAAPPAGSPAAEALGRIVASTEEALEGKAAADATSRNALNKFHCAVTKLVGAIETSEAGHEETLMESVERGGDDEEGAVMDDDTALPAPEAEGTIMPAGDLDDAESTVIDSGRNGRISREATITDDTVDSLLESDENV